MQQFFMRVATAALVLSVLGSVPACGDEFQVGPNGETVGGGCTSDGGESLVCID
jgi:hypothetical protein